MKKILKILVYSFVLILTIYLFISIAREYIAYKYLSDHKESLKYKRRDIKHQYALLKRSLRYSHSNAETYFELGRLGQIGKSRDERARSYTMSRDYFLEGLTCKPTDGRNRAVYAWYSGNQANHTVEHFDMAISLNPTDAYIHKLYAIWYMNQVKREIDITDTIQLLERYSKWQDKDDPLKAYGGRYVKGINISDLLRNAQTEWDKVQSLVSRRHWNWGQAIHKNLADLNLLSFELDRAIKYYKLADKKLMLARCYIIKDDPVKAVNILVSVIKEGGTLYRGNLSEIKKLLILSIDYDPNSFRSFYWLGKIHTRLGKPEKAIGNFRTTVQLNPKHIDAHMNLAKLYNQTGKVDLAIDEYETILELAPHHKEATRLLSKSVMAKYQGSDLTINP